MFDVSLISTHITENKSVNMFGKTYEVKNCVYLVCEDVVKANLVLASDTEELTVFIDMKNYPTNKLVGVKND